MFSVFRSPQKRDIERELAAAAASRVRGRDSAVSEVLQQPDEKTNSDGSKRLRLTPTKSRLFDTPFDSSVASRLPEAEDLEPGEDGLVNCYKDANLMRSEVIQELQKKSTEVTELTQKVMRLEQQLESAHVGKEQADLRVRQLETAAQSSASRLESHHAMVSQETTQLHEELQEVLDRNAKLAEDLKKSRKERDQAEDVAREAKRCATQSDSSLQQVMADAARERRSLQRTLEDTQLQMEEAHSQLQLTVRREQNRADLAEAAAKAATVERDLALEAQQDAERRAREDATAIARLEQAAALSTNNIGTGNQEQVKDLQEQVTMQRGMLQKYEAEVAAARKMKAHMQSVDVLREKLASAEARAERAEKGIAGLAAEEARAAVAEQSLAQWNSELIKLPGITHPSHLATKLAELQRDAALAADKAGENAAAAAIAVEAQKAAEANTALLAEKLRAQQAALDAAMEEGHRAERQAALLKQEVETVQRRLTSCQHELAVRGTGAAAVGRDAPTGGSEASEEAVLIRTRVEELEAKLSSTETQLKQADAAAQQSATSAAESRKELVAVTQRADAAEARVRSLESEAGALAKEVAVLEKKVGGGDYNRATTKVLHFKMNPETETHQTEAEKEVIALRIENQELKTSLTNLEKRKGGPMDSDELRAEGGVAVGSAALAVAQAQHTVLEQRVADLEKREVRYKAVFKEQITNFREACFRLFGYKVDMQTEQGKGKVPLVAITSMFAVSNNEQLIFKLTQGGGMELQPNAYSMQPEMQKQVDTFVTKFRSIPAFIANHTMELFNKNTLQ